MRCHAMSCDVILSRGVIGSKPRHGSEGIQNPLRPLPRLGLPLGLGDRLRPLGQTPRRLPVAKAIPVDRRGVEEARRCEGTWNSL